MPLTTILFLLLVLVLPPLHLSSVVGSRCPKINFRRALVLCLFQVYSILNIKAINFEYVVVLLLLPDDMMICVIYHGTYYALFLWCVTICTTTSMLLKVLIFPAHHATT